MIRLPPLPWTRRLKKQNDRLLGQGPARRRDDDDDFDFEDEDEDDNGAVGETGAECGGGGDLSALGRLPALGEKGETSSAPAPTPTPNDSTKKKKKKKKPRASARLGASAFLKGQAQPHPHPHRHAHSREEFQHRTVSHAPPWDRNRQQTDRQTDSP